MTAPIPLVLCGSGFGHAHATALRRSSERFQVLGVLAEDPPNTQLADAFGVPQWTRLEQLPERIGLSVWLSAAGHRVPLLERTSALLERGISILAEAGLEHDALAECVRSARRTRASFRLTTVVDRTPSAQRFLGAAKALRAHAPIRSVAAACTTGSLHVLLALLSSALGGVRPWHFPNAIQLAQGVQVLAGRVAEVPVVMRLHNDPAPAPHTIELTLSHDAGKLTLTGVHGQVRWAERATGISVSLGGAPASRDQEARSLVHAMATELTAFASALDHPQGDAGEAQHRLALARVHHQIIFAVGAPPEVSAEVIALPTSVLAAAAVEAAGDDLAVDDGAPSYPTHEETHDAAMRSLAGSAHGSAAGALESLPLALRHLEAISLRALSDLLLASTALTENGAARSATEILASLRAAPRHAWLVRRWLVALTREGALTNDRDGYRWQRSPRDAGGPADLRDGYAALAFPPAMAKLHASALHRLPQLVSDEITLPRLLADDASLHNESALSAYQDNVFTAYLNAACAHVAQRFATLRHGPLRVLELGGGEGRSTTAVLGALEHVPLDYLFTDVSPGCVGAAQERFGHGAGRRYGRLDINADFAAQGIAPESSDLVIAGNVFHNAAHLGRTLRRVRRAMPSGGWLVFTDSTHENGAMLSAIMFLLSGAPGAPSLGREDRRAQTGSVFLDAAGWHAELLAAGFVPQFVLPDASSPLAAAGQHLFFATAF